MTRGPESRRTARAGRLSLAALALTVGAALAVKLAVLAALGEHPLLQPLGELDTAAYVDLASRMAAHGPLSVAEPLAVSPLYVFFLAGVFAAAGRSLLAARLIQVVLGSAAVALIWLTSARWFDRRVAGVAAATAVMTGFFTFSEVVILQSALDPFLTALTLWATTWALQATTVWPAMAAGASAGLLALNRPNALAWALVLPFVLAVARWRVPVLAAPGRRWPARLASPVLALVGLALVIAPNAWRNHVVSGEWLPISSHGGLNLLIGNGPGATGTYRAIEGISPSIAGQDRDAARVAGAALGRRLSAAEVSAYFARRAWEWMANHPAEAAALAARKVLLLLNRTDVPLNFSYAYFQKDEPSLLRFLVVGPWLLVPLGLTGLCLRPRYSRLTRQAARPAPPARGGGQFIRPDCPPNYWAWTVFVPVYAASVVVFFVADRYRLPLLVPLCVGTGVAVVWFWDRFQARRIGSSLVPLGAIAALAVIAHLNLGLDDGRGGEQIRRAIWLIERGAASEALEYVERIAPVHPHPGVLRFRVATALAAAGQFDAAAASFQAARAIDGDRPAIRFGLGEALLAGGHAADAVEHLEAAVRAQYRLDRAAVSLVRALAAAGRDDEIPRVVSSLPGLPEEWPESVALELGTAALEQRAAAVAEPWLRAAVDGLERAASAAVASRTMPAGGLPAADEELLLRAAAHERLGVALVMLKRAPEAVPHLEAACRFDPAQASAHLNLAVAYAECRRFSEARNHAAEAARLDPGDAQAAALLRTLRARQ